MTSGNAGLFKRVGFLFLILLAPIAIFNLPKYINQVNEYHQIITSYTSFEGGLGKNLLPISEFKPPAQSPFSITGHFTVSVDNEEMKYLYLPFHVGRLKFWIGGRLFFDSNITGKPTPVTQIPAELIEIPIPKNINIPGGGGNIKIFFEAISSQSGLLSVSNIYVGSIDMFNAPAARNYFYYNTYRTGLLGVQLALLIILLSLFILKGVGREAVAPIVILVFFVISGLASLAEVLPGKFFLSQFSISMSPIVVIAAIKFFNDVKSRNSHKDKDVILLVFAVVFFVPPVLMYFGLFDFVKYNIYFAMPILISGLLALSLWSIISYLRFMQSDVGFWALSSTVMLAAIFHDLLFRLAVLNVAGVTAILSSSVFIVILSLTFIQLILKAKSEIDISNQVLKNALIEKTKELKSEFEISARLINETTATAEQARLTRELHDGVLTYMGMINALSEKTSDPTLQKINQLARYVVNEIRVILNARPVDQDSLVIALGALREQMVDPLQNMGVEVEWSNIALLNYGAIDPKALMNIIRIVQEAIHNGVTRAECTHLSVMAQRLDDKFKIVITNAGGTPFSEKAPRGQGITNMMERAALIGGELVINPTDCGAVVTLSMPLPVRLLSKKTTTPD